MEKGDEGPGIRNLTEETGVARKEMHEVTGEVRKRAVMPVYLLDILFLVK